MITQFIIIILSVLTGYFLRDLRAEKIKEKTQQIKKKILPNKSGVVEWTPPQSEEEKAEEEVRKGLNK